MACGGARMAHVAVGHRVHGTVSRSHGDLAERTLERQFALVDSRPAFDIGFVLGLGRHGDAVVQLHGSGEVDLAVFLLHDLAVRAVSVLKTEALLETAADLERRLVRERGAGKRKDARGDQRCGGKKLLLHVTPP